MHPALPVIFFTTLSAAGYGLLAWLGLSLFMLHARADLIPTLQPLYLWALAIGLALSTAGLLRWLLHPGRPLHSWRALSQWRTSWPSREVVLALATTLPALTLLALLLLADPGPGRALLLGMCGLLLAPLSLATVACTAMAYSSPSPVPAWRHPLVVPVSVLFALLTGLALLFWLMTVLLPFARGESGMLLTLTLLGALLAACKAVYWRLLDRQPPPVAGGGADSPPDREATTPEHPHTEATHAEAGFIARETVFALARRHALALRLTAAGLLFIAPLLAWALAATGVLPLGTLLAATCLALLAGALAERWLFFAQARHTVALYY